MLKLTAKCRSSHATQATQAAIESGELQQRLI